MTVIVLNQSIFLDELVHHHSFLIKTSLNIHFPTVYNWIMTVNKMKIIKYFY